MATGKEWLSKMKKGELTELAEHLDLKEYDAPHIVAEHCTRKNQEDEIANGLVMTVTRKRGRTTSSSWWKST